MAVTITTIPAPYRAGFANIKRLAPDTFDQILLALESAPLSGGFKQLAASVLKQVSTVKREEIEDILRSVFSLSVFMTDEETPLPDNLSSLSRAMIASGNQDLSLSGEEQRTFESRLQRLLTTKSVAISSKGQRLRLEYPVTFHNAVIMTDMRPIFDKPEERPVGCVVSHAMRIGYHENSEHKEFFVILDDDDLEVLGRVIERAKAKAGSIKSLLKLANLPDLS